MKRLIAVLAVSLAVPACAWAHLTTITFTELPTQPVNGVSLEGVTFADTTGATFNAPNGGQLTYVQDPCLEGNNAGEALTLTFATPTPFLQFGVALSTQATVPVAVTVVLSGPSGPLGTHTAGVKIHNGGAFSDGQFTYEGAPVTTANITFNAAAATSFGFDNLTFGTPDATVPIPALDNKAMALLMLFVIVAGAWLLRRRQLRTRVIACRTP
jgi:hypothetical protein